MTGNTYRLSLLSGVAAILMGAGQVAGADPITFVDANGSLGNMTVSWITDGQNYFSGTEAGQYNFIVGGKNRIGFCTDVNDNLTAGTWDATKTTLHDSTNGLTETWYEKIINITPQNVDAINYLVNHYIGSSMAPAAQVAIWDLSLNGGVQQSAPNTYHWSSVFSATGIGLADVYNLEHLALTSPAGPDALFYNAGPRNDNVRMQDIAFASVPETHSVAGLAGMLGMGALLGLRRRKSNVTK